MPTHFKTADRKRMTSGGFTLIELMVSLGLFSIVMTISVGSLLVMIDVNAKAQALYTSNTNLSFALDSMSREIRTGYRYYCSTSATISMPPKTSKQDCTTAGSGKFISFTREKDVQQSGYRLIESDEIGQLQQYSNGSWIPITSPQNIDIDIFGLTVQHTDVSGDDRQPTVDIFVKGTMSNGLDVATEFSIQTHVTQRRFDI